MRELVDRLLLARGHERVEGAVAVALALARRAVGQPDAVVEVDHVDARDRAAARAVRLGVVQVGDHPHHVAVLGAAWARGSCPAGSGWRRGVTSTGRRESAAPASRDRRARARRRDRRGRAGEQGAGQAGQHDGDPESLHAALTSSVRSCAPAACIEARRRARPDRLGSRALGGRAARGVRGRSTRPGCRRSAGSRPRSRPEPRTRSRSRSCRCAWSWGAPASRRRRAGGADCVGRCRSCSGCPSRRRRRVSPLSLGRVITVIGQERQASRNGFAVRP